MTAAPIRAELRPRTVSEIVDAAIELLRAHPRPLFLVGAVTATPLIAVSVVNYIIMGPVGMQPGDFDPRKLVPVLVLSLLGFCWYAVGDGALVAVASELYLEGRAEPAAAIRAAMKRWTSLVTSDLLKTLIAMGGMIGPGVVAAIAIPLIAKSGNARSVGVAIAVVLILLVMLVFALSWPFYAFSRYFLTSPAIMVEGARARESLRRSKALTLGTRRRVMGMILILFAVALALWAVVAVTAGVLTQNAGAGGAVGNVLYIVYYPFAALTRAILYFDLRIRREGFDIERLAAELSPSVPAA